MLAGCFFNKYSPSRLPPFLLLTSGWLCLQLNCIPICHRIVIIIKLLQIKQSLPKQLFLLYPDWHTAHSEQSTVTRDLYALDMRTEIQFIFFNKKEIKKVIILKSTFPSFCTSLHLLSQSPSLPPSTPPFLPSSFLSFLLSCFLFCAHLFVALHK